MSRAKYDVFVRDWWRPAERGEAGWPQNRVPYAGAPKEYIAHGVSEAVARRICAEYAAENDPGPMSRKAEYESA